MICDLNIPFSAVQDYTKTMQVLEKLDYELVAFNLLHQGKLPQAIKNPITVAATVRRDRPAPTIKTVNRLTLVLNDNVSASTLALLASEFDILAVRPTNEKVFAQVCGFMDVDVISIDCTERLSFHPRRSILRTAVKRGLHFELCYAAGVRDASARRNIITNATAIIRCTKGKAILISSEASTPLSLRGPYDVANLATFWGLNDSQAMEAVKLAPDRVLAHAQTRKNIYKGVISSVSLKRKRASSNCTT